jgi:imidazolonepropionase-like amidohydrolase
LKVVSDTRIYPNAANAMGASEQVGRIKPGMLADLVIVADNLLSDISDLFDVQGVMLNRR